MICLSPLYDDVFTTQGFLASRNRKDRSLRVKAWVKRGVIKHGYRVKAAPAERRHLPLQDLRVRASRTVIAHNVVDLCALSVCQSRAEQHLTRRVAHRQMCPEVAYTVVTDDATGRKENRDLSRARGIDLVFATARGAARLRLVEDDPPVGVGSRRELSGIDSDPYRIAASGKLRRGARYNRAICWYTLRALK